MAIKTITQLVSDLSGEGISDGEGRTVRFGYDGTQYELELTNREVDKFSKALKPYIDVARKAPGTQRRRGSATAGSGTGVDSKAVRAWAKANNVDVPDRGRLPGTVVEQYKAAGN